VFQGHLFAFDQIISESPKRLDPLTPMRDPNLVRVLQQQTRHRVGLIRHEDFKAGAKAVCARVEGLKKDGIRYAIADGADEDDLIELAAVSVDWPLMTGGSSVAVYYPDLWRARGLVGEHSMTTLPKVEGPAAVLAGSCAERTAEQLEHFGRRWPVLTLDVADAAGDSVAADKAIAWAAELLASSPVAITTAARPEVVAAIQARFGRRRAARMAEQLLGRIAVGLRALGVRRFVIAGGETSGAVVESLRIRALAVGPYEAPGQSKAVAIAEQPLSFYLKSGKLGPVDMFERVLGETTSASSA